MAERSASRGEQDGGTGHYMHTSMQPHAWIFFVPLPARLTDAAVDDGRSQSRSEDVGRGERITLLTRNHLRVIM